MCVFISSGTFPPFDRREDESDDPFEEAKEASIGNSSELSEKESGLREKRLSKCEKNSCSFNAKNTEGDAVDEMRNSLMSNGSCLEKGRRRRVCQREAKESTSARMICL